MKTPQEKFRRPELFLQELLRSYAKGLIVESPLGSQLLLRATVLAVDPEGGSLSNPTGTGEIAVGDTTYRATVGPRNPANSIKARILTRGLDRFVDDQETRVFWPLSQNDHVSLPIKPGEHVYVLFEDKHMEHGLWVSKVSGQDDPNFFAGAGSYDTSIDRRTSDLFSPEEKQEITDRQASDSVQPSNLNELFF